MALPKQPPSEEKLNKAAYLECWRDALAKVHAAFSELMDKVNEIDDDSTLDLFEMSGDLAERYKTHLKERGVDYTIHSALDDICAAREEAEDAFFNIDMFLCEEIRLLGIRPQKAWGYVGSDILKSESQLPTP